MYCDTEARGGSVSLKQDSRFDAKWKKRELGSPLTGDTRGKDRAGHAEPQPRYSDLENKDHGSSLWKHITSKSEFIYWDN